MIDSATRKLSSSTIVARALRATAEPPLNVNAPSSALEVFRVTDIFAHGGANVLRLERRGNGWELVRKILSQQAAPDAPPPIMRSADSVFVSEQQAARVIASIRGSNYWRNAATKCEFGIDGHYVLVEARSRSVRVAQLCWVPDSTRGADIFETVNAFRDLALRMLPPVGQASP